jgi:hypothetical protein
MPQGLKPFSEADKRAAIELWKAEEHLRHQPGAAEEGDPEAVGHQNGGLCLLQGPGVIHALETQEGDRTRWQQYPLLKSC